MASARVTYVDRDATLRALHEAAERLAASRPEIEEILLFGSYARGDCVPASDADLLIVLGGSALRARDRIPDYLLLDTPVPVDVIPLTRAEIEQRTASGDRFLARILAETTPLMRRPGAAADAR